MDAQMILNFVLGVLTLFFGGGLIVQWLTIKSLRRQKAAEATKAEVDALRAIESDNRYNTLYAEYYKLKSEFEQYKITNHQ